MRISSLVATPSGSRVSSRLLAWQRSSLVAYPSGSRVSSRVRAWQRSGLGLSERFSDFVAPPSGSCVSASGPSSVFAADVRMSASLFALAVRVVRSVTPGVVVWAP